MTVTTVNDAPNAKVFLDGVDVSSLCTAADPDEGWADLLPGGKCRADAEGNVITERKYGDVRVEIHVKFQTDETIHYCGRESTGDAKASASPFVKL